MPDLLLVSVQTGFPISLKRQNRAISCELNPRNRQGEQFRQETAWAEIKNGNYAALLLGLIAASLVLPLLLLSSACTAATEWLQGDGTTFSAVIRSCNAGLFREALHEV